MNKKVLLGMSGGVDSSVAAIILKEKGYDVIGVTMKLFKEADEIEVDAKKMCQFLSIPHYTIDFSKEFKKYVVDDFICQYQSCRTPNPCIECNKYLKFGAMYEKAIELGCNYIATGHYAKVEFDEKYQKNVLKMSKAGKKDQSYVLYSINKELINHVLFPLSDFTCKQEIRDIAVKYELPVAQKPDSEDICFIPDGNYKKFLEGNSNLKENEGNIVNISGKVLGKHKGLYKYTIGQRKGLGISNSVPLFVIGFNTKKNELLVGTQEELYKKEFWVKDVNLLLFDDITVPMQVGVKIRYSAPVAMATIKKEGEYIKVIFDEPQKSVTPGQSAVFYDEDIVIGGGKIVDIY